MADSILASGLPAGLKVFGVEVVSKADAQTLSLAGEMTALALQSGMDPATFGEAMTVLEEHGFVRFERPAPPPGLLRAIETLRPGLLEELKKGSDPRVLRFQIPPHPRSGHGRPRGAPRA